MNLPNPQPVLELIEAFRRSKTMFAAVSMGVFDVLHEAPASAADLAARLGANAGCDGTAAGWLRRARTAAQARIGVYENDPVAETYLYSGSDHSLRGYVRYSDAALYEMWGHLEDAVREGTHRWTQSFGLEGPIFSAFFRTDEAMRDFLMGMHGFGMLTSAKLVSAFDLSRFRRLVDLGGATGHLAIAACERYAKLHAVVFDLPRADRAGTRAGGEIRRRANGLKSWPEIFSKTNCPRRICITSAGFCTTGRRKRSTACLPGFSNGCRRAAPC